MRPHRGGVSHGRDHQAVEANQVAKALKFVQLGELSAGQALEGAELAPGTTATLRAFRNRSTTPLDAIPELPRDFTVFNLDEVLFGKNVRSGRCSWRHSGRRASMMWEGVRCSCTRAGRCSPPLHPDCNMVATPELGLNTLRTTEQCLMRTTSKNHAEVQACGIL